jgi:hypothetical protein
MKQVTFIGISAIFALLVLQSAVRAETIGQLGQIARGIKTPARFGV